MIDLAGLEGMDVDALRAWIVRRVRGQEADPPLSPMHQETPDDFIAVVYGQTTKEDFRKRLEAAVVAALREVAKNPDLRAGADADAVRYLASLSQSRELRAAMPVLIGLAERGILGGAERELEPLAERAVLRALARLQPANLLAHHWREVWRARSEGEAELWPVIIAGLRRSVPEQALALLPEIVERSKTSPEFPLGEVLWAFRADPSVGPSRLSKALGALGQAERHRCRQALRNVGASQEQLEELLPPAPGPGVQATKPGAWSERGVPMPAAPPRWSGAARGIGVAAAQG